MMMLHMTTHVVHDMTLLIWTVWMMWQCQATVAVVNDVCLRMILSSTSSWLGDMNLQWSRDLICGHELVSLSFALINQLACLATRISFACPPLSPPSSSSHHHMIRYLLCNSLMTRRHQPEKPPSLRWCMLIDGLSQNWVTEWKGGAKWLCIV